MKTELVRFHDTEQVCFTNEALGLKPYVAVRPVAEGIGLDADRAVRTLKNHPVLGAKVSVQTGLDASNRQWDMHCLSLTHLPGWLFTINPNKVSAQIRPRLILFQEECYEALYDHFFGKTRAVFDNVKAIHALRLELRQMQDEAAQHEANLKRCKSRMLEILAQIDTLNAESGFQLGLFEALPTVLPLN